MKVKHGAWLVAFLVTVAGAARAGSIGTGFMIYADTANVVTGQQSNAIAQAQADIIAVSNAAAIHAALTAAAHGGLISTSTCQTIINAIAATGTYHHATSAGSLCISGGWGVFSVSGSTFSVTTWTNTTAVYVSATNGSGYNGPAVGTTYANPAWNGDFNYWVWEADGISVYGLGAGGATPYECVSFSVDSWIGNAPLPSVFAKDGGTGTFTLAWVPATNTVSWDMGSFLTAESDPVFTNWASTNTYIVTSTNLAAQDAAGKYVPTSRTITVNGQVGTLDSNVVFDIPITNAAYMESSTNFVITVSNGLTWVDAGASTGFVFRFTLPGGGSTNVFLP